MKRLMLSAMASGSGKTVLTCGLMRAFQCRGLRVQGFKCGPDYIDPMFHTRVLGVPSRNLDLFLQDAEGVRRTLGAGQGDLALLEGAMGFYDGIGCQRMAGRGGDRYAGDPDPASEGAEPEPGGPGSRNAEFST